MTRREFIVLVGCAAVAWSTEGHAQQHGKFYRIGLLTNGLVIGATDERRKNLVSSLAWLRSQHLPPPNLVFPPLNEPQQAPAGPAITVFRRRVLTGSPPALERRLIVFPKAQDKAS